MPEIVYVRTRRGRIHKMAQEGRVRMSAEGCNLDALRGNGAALDAEAVANADPSALCRRCFPLEIATGEDAPSE